MRYIAFLLLSAQIVFAVIPPTAVWEYRQTATGGNNLNGGFFNAALGGVDYTLQDGPQTSGTDGVGVGTLNFSSATATFTSQMVGNALHITTGGGMTVGWYQIDVFVDANNVTLDRTPGTGTAATFRVGGALSLNSTLDAEGLSAAVAGNVIYFKYNATAFEAGENVLSTANGTGTANIWMIGYDTNRSIYNEDANMARINFTGAEQLTTGNNWTVRRMDLRGVSTAVIIVGTDCAVARCKIWNTTATDNSDAIRLNTGSYVFWNDLLCLNGDGVEGAGVSSCVVRNNYIRACNIGVNPGVGSGWIVQYNLIVDAKTAGFSTSATTARDELAHNIFYGAENTNSIGIRTTGATALNIKAVNNTFIKLTSGIVIGTVQQDSIQENWNNFYANGTDRTLIATGPNSTNLNPGFTSVTQITGSTATTSGSVLTQSGGDFSTVTDNVDWVRVVSGTGVTVDTYLITGHSGTTLTTNNALGTSSAGDVVYVVYTGTNFLPTTPIYTVPGLFPGSETTGFNQMGSVIMQPGGGAGGEHSSVF